MCSIRKVSKKQSIKIREYKKVRDAYFEKHPNCEFPNCGSTDITLHHMKGRIGNDLTDDRYFKSLCLKHHNWVEENPKEAKELGLSVDRLTKN